MYNRLLKKMAKKMNVYYLDVNEAVTNKKGILPKEASADGVHLTKSYCEKWMNYLKSHTVKPIVASEEG